MPERRKFKRINTNAMVRWKKFTANPEHTPSFPATARNLSSGGVCFYTYSKLLKGDKIRVEIIMPNQTVAQFKGIVVWFREDKGFDAKRLRYEVGVRILDATPQDIELINKYTFFNFFDRQSNSTTGE